MSTRELCPSCGASEACLLRDCGEFALCRAVVSSLPMLGGGWLHAVVAEPAVAVE